MKLPPQASAAGLNAFFDWGASSYDLLTDNALWSEQVGRLLEQVPPDFNARVQRALDLGCGPGVSAFVLAKRLPAAQVIGLDFAAGMLEVARKHQRARALVPVAFLRADGARLPFPSASFDLITGHSFLYLVPDPAGVLKEARRVLRPGGRLVFMEPNAQGSLRRAARRALPSLGEFMVRPAAAGRLATSMLMWRIFSGLKGRLSEDAGCALLREAGFLEAKASPTLGGLGLHFSARAGE